MSVACEKMVRYVLPWIRREMAKTMVHELGNSQVNVSKILGVTESAISQYLASKRGNEIFIADERIIKATREAAMRINENGSQGINREICNICRLIRTSDAIPEVYKKKVGDLEKFEECICDMYE